MLVTLHGIKTKSLLEQNGFLEVLVYSNYAARLASVLCNVNIKMVLFLVLGNLRQ
jgi:hypothetical protein